MSYDVIIYSKPSCMPCKMSKRILDEGGVDYIERDVTEDPSAADTVRLLGYQGVPVVTVAMEDGTDHWYGYQPMKLRSVVEIAGRGA